MTKHESFKRRVRERMEKTGERYGAARRALLGGLAEPATAGRAERPDPTPGPRARSRRSTTSRSSGRRAATGTSGAT